MREFSPHRLLWLIRVRVVRDLTPILLGAAAIAGLYLLALLVSWAFHVPLSPPQVGDVKWPTAVIITCLLTSALAFRDMQSAKSSTDWLLLPATTAEKYLAALLETQVVVPVVTSLLGLAFWVVTGGFAMPAVFGVWQAWAGFVVANLVLFTGSTVFRKLSALKTLGLVIAFGIVLALALTSGLKLVGAFFATSFASNVSNGVITEADFALHFGEGKFTSDFLAAFWQFGVFVVTPAFALAFGYFRVKEKEARDAVQ